MTGIQRRFKQWREHEGLSLREIQRAVNPRLPEKRRIQSPATISNYEVSAKAPPRSDFLSALAAAYPERLNPTWLLTGEGEMDPADEEERRRRRYELPDRPLLEAVKENHPWFGQLTIGVQQTFLDLLRNGLERQTPGGAYVEAVDAQEEDDAVREERLEVADDLIFLLTLPLRSWGFRFPGFMREEAVESMDLPEPVDADAYFRLMLSALVTVVKGAGGDSLAHRPGSIVPALRRALEEGCPEPSEEETERAERAARLLEEVRDSRAADLEIETEPTLTSNDDSEPPSRVTLEEALEGTRRDLKQAREDDLSPEIIERLKDQVERLEERLEEKNNRGEED